MNIKVLNYFKIDLKRAILSFKFLISIISVAIILIWSSLSSNGKIKENTIIFLLWWSAYNIRYVFVMFFCSIPYAGCFCEDLENGYIKQLVARGNLLSYCISKTMSIVVSAIGTMVIGVCIFVLLLKFFIPWTELNNSVYLAAIRSGSFHSIILTGHYFIYSLLFAFQFGLLTAILALLSACVSLFLSNKLLVWSIPIIAYYLISQYSWTLFSGSYMLDFDIIFSGRYNIFNNDLLSFLYA
ncbi:hypothetical protein CG709_01450, partial [Lachnotalea glycerini]